jgi:hypothetical protein
MMMTLITRNHAMHGRASGIRDKAGAVAVSPPPHEMHGSNSSIAFKVAICASSLIFSLHHQPPAFAASGPPETVEAKSNRCTISAFDKFASTRAKFSMEASGGGMEEATVDVRGCDFRGSVLDGKVLSGVLMTGANCDQCSIVRSEAARADLRSASFQGVSFEDSNLFGTQFGGADLRGARFDNAILGNATFAKGLNGEWANLEGTHFEGALLSSSDIERLCANPTLDSDVRKFELGCRAGR